MIERAGIRRRGLAALVDMFIVQVVFQGLVAVLFAASGDHVTTGYSLYTACESADVSPGRIALPGGVTSALRGPILSRGVADLAPRRPGCATAAPNCGRHMSTRFH